MGKPAVIVTGAAQGIGRAITEKLLREDWRVIACDKNATALKMLVEEVPNASLSAHPLDVSDSRQISALFADISNMQDALKGLVNNAGIYWGKAFLDYTPAMIQEVMAANLFGALYCSQEFWRIVSRTSIPGVIVNIASVAGQAGSSDVVYGTSKAALLGLTKMCAGHFAPHVRVNAVAPGLVATEMMEAVPPAIRAHYQQTELLKAPITPSGIAEAAHFLLSDGSRHITGATLDVNNGVYLR